VRSLACCMHCGRCALIVYRDPFAVLWTVVVVQSCDVWLRSLGRFELPHWTEIVTSMP
jgi:hypothetical protein